MRLVVGFVIAAGVLFAVSSLAARVPVRTVITFHGDARTVAVRGDLVAWTDSALRFHMARMNKGGLSSQSYGSPYSAWDVDGTQLTFAGARPAWIGMTQQGTFGTVVERVWTTAPSGRKRLVVRVEHGDSTDGTYLTSLAGSPAGGAFGTERIVDAEPGCACKFVREGGGVWAFGADGAHRVPGLPPPALLARWDRNVALVPLEVATPTDAGGAAGYRAKVEIWSLADSSMISSFDSPQPIDDLALTERYVFTIVGYGKSTQLQVHDPATGALIRAVRAQSLRYLDQVGVIRPPTFSAVGHWAVYGQPHSVWAVDGTTGEVSRLTHTTWFVRDVSTDGRTVSWLEVRRVPGTGNKPPREQWLSRILTATLSER